MARRYRKSASRRSSSSRAPSRRKLSSRGGRGVTRQRVEVVIRQEPTNSGAYAGDGVAVTQAAPTKRRRF